jgi:5-methylcytosine-specific restriction endonuclease McrA
VKFKFTYQEELLKQGLLIKNETAKKRKKRKLLQLSNNICGICGQPTSLKKSNIDHIIPKSKGGSNRLDNLQVAHIKCNQLKGNKI